MYREWSLSKTLTADNGEFKHEMPDNFLRSSADEDSSVLEMDDDPMDYIENDIELPIYIGIFEFLGFFLGGDEEDDEDQQEDSETRTCQQKDVDHKSERQDNNSTEDVCSRSQIELETTSYKEGLQHSLIMQGEDLSDPLPKKERDMRISVRANKSLSMSLPVILDDSSKSSKESFNNSLHEKDEVSINKFKPPSKEKESSRTKTNGNSKRNKISTTNTVKARRQSLTKQTRHKEQRSTNKSHTNIVKEKKKEVVRSKAVEVPVHPPQRRNKLDLDEAMNKRILEGKKRREENKRKYEINKANRFQIFARMPSHSKIYAASKRKPKETSKVAIRAVTPEQTPIERNTRKVVTPDQAKTFYEKQLKLQQDTKRKIRAKIEKHYSRC